MNKRIMPAIGILIGLALFLLLANAVFAAPAAGCQRVRITGSVSNVSCAWTGRCVGYMWTGSGYNASRVHVSGWRLREGQTVSKTLFVCG